MRFLPPDVLLYGVAEVDIALGDTPIMELGVLRALVRDANPKAAAAFKEALTDYFFAEALVYLLLFP